ncbi:MAG: GNAT family N-acetyltransferase [Chloroflexi bacterium]|nr:MAG: GNAT family N-acetyltransferase [Chloroflexota bacterium]
MSSGARGPVNVRMGSSTDVDSALSIYLRSNLVRRHGRAIPAERMEQVADNLRNPVTWFLIAEDGGESVGMALAMPARDDAGAGPLIAGACYLDLIYVLPDRWGEGVGGVLLDGVLDEARRRGYSRVQLSTHEDNERSHRLYRSRGFSPAGLPRVNDAGDRVGEWVRSIDESKG